MLGKYLPVPEEELVRDFGERRLTTDQVAAATLAWLTKLGVGRVYLSNIETGSAAAQLRRIRAEAGLPAVADLRPPSRLRRPGTQ